MKKPCLIYLAFAILLVPVTARGGEWVMWKTEHIDSADTSDDNPTWEPLEEFQTLKKCKDAAKQRTADLESWARHHEDVRPESIHLIAAPAAGITYTTKKSSTTMSLSFPCYPYGMVPSISH